MEMSAAPGPSAADAFCQGVSSIKNLAAPLMYGGITVLPNHFIKPSHRLSYNWIMENWDFYLNISLI